MLLVTSFALLSLGNFVSAKCGTSPPSDALRILHQEHQSSQDATNNAYREGSSEFSQTIDTYVHIIQGDDSVDLIPQVREQIDVLNNKYIDAGFTFNLVDVHTVIDQSWLLIEPQSPTEYDIKSSLRKGLYRDLNLYIDTIIPIDGNELLGYATFPEEANDEAFATDGVVIAPAALPGGKAPYDLGITAVHEVGHWLGLFHTFEPDPSLSPESGCLGAGDYVSDTPAEDSPAHGCQQGRDSCPLQPGLDPVHNFMDYSDDSCLNQFTPGQIERMQSMFLKLRADYTGGTEGEQISA